MATEFRSVWLSPRLDGRKLRGLVHLWNMRDEDITKLMDDIQVRRARGGGEAESVTRAPPKCARHRLRMRALGWRTAENVRLWHLADLDADPEHVRSWG